MSCNRAAHDTAGNFQYFEPCVRHGNLLVSGPLLRIIDVRPDFIDKRRVLLTYKFEFCAKFVIGKAFFAN